MQVSVGRAGAFGEDQHAKTIRDSFAAGIHHVGRIERVRRALEQARAVQQWPPPAATIQHGLHGRGDVLDRRHERRHIEQARVVGHEHGRTSWQLASHVTRVEIQQRGPAQQIVQQHEMPAHDALQQARAPRSVTCGEQVQDCKCAVAEGRHREVERENSKQSYEAKRFFRLFHHASIRHPQSAQAAGARLSPPALQGTRVQSRSECSGPRATIESRTVTYRAASAKRPRRIEQAFRRAPRTRSLPNPGEQVYRLRVRGDYAGGT